MKYSGEIFPSSQPGSYFAVPVDLENQESLEILGELRQLLLKAFILYVKAKNFHWHAGERHSRDYRLLLEMQADEIVAVKNEILKQAEKCGEGCKLWSGEEHLWRRLAAPMPGNPRETFRELMSEQRHFARLLRNARELCLQYRETSLVARIEEWISQSEWRAWFLMETVIDWEDPSA